MNLTPAEMAYASLAEHFPVSMSEVAENDYVAALEKYDSTVLARATADILGKSDHQRGQYYIGKFPSIDEMLPRCRYHENRRNEYKRAKDAPRIKHRSSNGPRDAQAIFKAKRRELFDGRPIVKADVDYMTWHAGVTRKTWPVGSKWCWCSGNVYGVAV